LRRERCDSLRGERRKEIDPVVRSVLVLAGLLLALKPGPAQTSPSAQGCDRECLRGTLTSYLNALVAHDPKSLPLAVNARFTENTAEKPLGEGLWKTASSLGSFRQDLIDVRQGVAGTHVVIEENGEPVLFQARLKVAMRRISEIDTTVVRNQAEGMIFRPNELKAASPAMNLTPERSQLNTREEMIRLALLYPAGLKVGGFVKVDGQHRSAGHGFRLGVLAIRRLSAAQKADAQQTQADQRQCGRFRRDLVIADYIEGRNLVRAQRRIRSRRSECVLYLRCRAAGPIRIVTRPALVEIRQCGLAAVDREIRERSARGITADAGRGVTVEIENARRVSTESVPQRGARTADAENLIDFVGRHGLKTEIAA
jgi:hypothetical protein